MADVLLTFPPRPLTADERGVLGTWLAAAGDVTSAYISERRSDDPTLYRRIVISLAPTRKPTYLVHAPSGLACWLVLAVEAGGEMCQFDSLRAALNSIRSVFVSEQNAA